ncbi:MAG: hypothetical protein H6562_04975 [Lewinellaceae bacterium]|nr:hypothetical protein [Lewinella sp.]MCB9278243.1 hypothetical protein [Lewinellaceae bacterium]
MQWTPIQKIAFRFFAIYLFLFAMSNQFVLSFAFDALWRQIVPWFAAHVLHLEQPITVFTNGSGDTTYNYVSLLVFALLALVATAVWTALDRRRQDYGKAFQWLVILIRYYVIYQMVIYGLAKLFYLQFQPPHFGKLIEPYGESSPMGLLWTFMGYSKGYTMFTGFGELAGGLLLLFRNTRTLGALVVFGVMANVMALNFFYDVPVKILSSHLVLMALFLIALDLRRVWQVFVANKAVEAVEIRPLFGNPALEKAKTIIKWMIIVAGLGLGTYSMVSMSAQYGPVANRPALHGLYEVTAFQRNGEELPPLLTDTYRWRWLVIDWKDRAMVKYMNDTERYFDFIPDTTLLTIAVKANGRDGTTDTLRYFPRDTSGFRIEGILEGDTLNIAMKPKKKEDFLLINRGFRWVSEYPFNK